MERQDEAAPRETERSHRGFPACYSFPAYPLLATRGTGRADTKQPSTTLVQAALPYVLGCLHTTQNQVHATRGSAAIPAAASRKQARQKRPHQDGGRSTAQPLTKMAAVARTWLHSSGGAERRSAHARLPSGREPWAGGERG